MRTDGFTFIEVLFALSIVALMAFTVGYTVILSLRAEERGRSMQEGMLLLSSHQAGAHLGLEGEESVLPGYATWNVSDEWVTIGQEPTQAVWRVTHIRRARPAFESVIALRDITR